MSTWLIETMNSLFYLWWYYYKINNHLVYVNNHQIFYIPWKVSQLLLWELKTLFSWSFRSGIRSTTSDDSVPWAPNHTNSTPSTRLSEGTQHVGDDNVWDTGGRTLVTRFFPPHVRRMRDKTVPERRVAGSWLRCSPQVQCPWETWIHKNKTLCHRCVFIA